MNNYTEKQNRVGSSVSEIIQYKQRFQRRYAIKNKIKFAVVDEPFLLLHMKVNEARYSDKFDLFKNLFKRVQNKIEIKPGK